jgi:ribosomal protein S18 acetylase RimI-like enzyme
VTSLSQEKTGEIESIFIEEAYRTQGIGSTLVTCALAWLDENGSVRNRVPVADGNEAVFGFYKKFGFYPRMKMLEQKRECGVPHPAFFPTSASITPPVPIQPTSSPAKPR